MPDFPLRAGARQGVLLAAAVAAALHALVPAPARAEPACYGAPSEIEDDMPGPCLVENDGVLTVTATGSIHSDDSTAVQVQGASAKVTNHGTIETAAGFTAAVRNDGTHLTLTNTGTISGAYAVINAYAASIDTLTNSGTITGRDMVAIRNEGHIVELLNTGTIGLDGGDATILNWAQLDTLTNQGTLSGAGLAVVSNNKTIGKLVNQSNIVGDGVAISNVDGGYIGEIVNQSGLIEGGETAIFNGAGSTIGSILNTGAITNGEQAGEFAAVIRNEGTISHGITNSGVIDGNVMLGSATLYLGGPSSRVTGWVNGDEGSSVVILTGFKADNDFSVDSVVVSSTGSLNLGNRSFKVRPGSSFQNQGNVQVPLGEPSMIGGDYVQAAGARLTVEAESPSNHGRLHVLGTASFEHGTGLHVLATKGNTLANGNLLAEVITAGSLHASDKTFVVSDNSELFNFRLTVNDDDTADLLTVLDDGSEPGGNDPGHGGGGSPGEGTPGGGGTGAGAVSSRVQAEGFGQGLGAARVLDGFVAASNNTGDLVEVVSAFGRLGSREEVADAVAQTLPLMSANLNQVTLGSMQGVNRVVQARLASVAGMSSGEGFLADKHIWFKPLASHADQNDRDGVAGYRANTYGFLFGGDALVGRSSRLGLAFSYARSDVEGKSTARHNRADIDAYQLIAYGSHQLAAMPDVEIDWQADIGLNQNDVRRSINFGGLDRTAESDFDSTTAHLGAGISRGFQVGETTRLTPSLRADYFRIRNESYTEKGADSLSLRVRSQTSEQLIAMLGGRLQQQLNARTALLVDLGAGYDLLGDGDSVTASYVGGGAAFSTPGMDARRWVGRAGLGLALQANERTEVTARYDLEGRSGFTAQTASVNVRWAF